MNATNAEPLGIVELVHTTARLATAFEQLFETLGHWATGDAEVADDRRRHFAVMSHRHAWHAELWRSRAPSIPIEAMPADDLGRPPTPDDEWYQSVVTDLRSEIEALAVRADPDVDPSTCWVAELTINTLR